jgi:hypothetical protein
VIHILISPDGRAYVHTWARIEGHWMRQSVQEAKTIEELQEWQQQQRDEFWTGLTPYIERTTPDVKETT